MTSCCEQHMPVAQDLVHIQNSKISRPNPEFLLFFRVMYLSILLGHTAFTLLGFSRMGTGIGIIATVMVAVGSEVAFASAKERENDISRRKDSGKDIRFVV